MHWDTGQMFEIFAVGDGFFMYKVLNAVAMMWNAGIFNSLGALGLLFGLLVMGATTVASGGQKMDIGSLFTGFILWAILFAGGASVTITEVGYNRPGSRGPGVYVVDNVPFGVAAMGWAVSTIGYKLTQTMEQSYGVVGEPASLLKTGHGRSLEWLAAVRMARSVNVGSVDNQFAVMRANLIGYMRYCSVQGLVRDPNRADVMTYQEDPFNTSTGFGFESEWVTTDWYTFVPGGGKPTRSEENCTNALTKLRAYWQTSQSYTDYANTVARPLGWTGAAGQAGQQAVDAAASLNLSLDHAQKYMLGSMVAGLWAESIEGNPLLTDEQVANRIMITQAVEQRATEAAAEESMFRRSMFPLMTFLECTLFICAPFMALAVGLGRAGLGMTAKYGLISLWVSLWLPTLAVINMFQVTSASQALDALTSTYTGGDASYRIGSVAASIHLENSVMDWLATGSMLAASTPLITLMFLMGSAYTATSLAGAFKGGDHVNEKLASPDIASAPAGISRGAAQTYSAGAGSTTTGTSLPSLSFGGESSISSSRSMQAANQTISDFTQREGTQVAQALTQDMVAGVKGSNSNSSRASMEHGQAMSALSSAGVEMGQLTTEGQRLVLGLAGSAQAGAGVSTAGVADMLGSIAKDKDSALGKSLTGLGKSISGRAGFNMTAKDDVSTMADHISRLASTVRSSMDNNESVRAAVAGANVATAEEFGSVSGSNSARLTNSSDFSKSMRDVSSASDTYSAGSAYSAKAASNQSMGLDQASQQVGASGQGERAIAAAIGTHGEQAFQDAKQSLEGKGMGNIVGYSSSGQAMTQRDVAAALMVLNGTAPSSHMNQSAMGDGKVEMMDILKDSGALNMSAGSEATQLAPQRGDVGARAQAESGQATAAVGGRSDLGAPEGTEERARGGYAGMSTPEGRAQGMGELAGMGLPVGVANQGGAQGAAYRGGDGGYDGGQFSSDTADLRARGQEQIDATHDAGKQQTGEAVAQIAAKSNSDDMHHGGSPKTGGEMFASMHRNAEGNTTDNADVGAAIETAKNGGFGTGPMSQEAATVFGTFQASNINGEAVSAAQAAAAQAAFDSLSPAEQAGVQALMAKTTPGATGVQTMPVQAGAALRQAPSLDDVPATKADVPASNFQTTVPKSMMGASGLPERDVSESDWGAKDEDGNPYSLGRDQ